MPRYSGTEARATLDGRLRLRPPFGPRVENHDASDFQAQRRAWNPRRPDIIELLETADAVEIQPIYYGSNHTFLVTLDAGDRGRSFAVYKPARGEYPLYDFPAGTLYKREAATWLLDDELKWGLVPPTVVGDGRYGVGSVQLFIEARSQGEVEVSELQRLVVLDILSNNADRKAEHCLIGRDGTLWGIDHGLTFNTQPKLRTVLWHFAGQSLPPEMLRDLGRLRTALSRCERPRVRQLAQLIARSEFVALRQRLDALLKDGVFPNPRYKSVPYRW